jgi:putative flippase GtrA
MKYKNLNIFERLGFFIIEHFNKFIYFCFVGFGAFLIDWIFFNAFYRVGINFIFSRTTSAIISTVFNFNINRYFTFRAIGHSIKKQIFRWIVVYSIAILANVVVGKLVLNLLGENIMNANIAYFAGILVAIPISFLGSLLWAFKKDKT